MDFSETKLDANYVPDTHTIAILRIKRQKNECNFQAPAFLNTGGWLRDFQCLQISNSLKISQKSARSLRESHGTEPFLCVINIEINYTRELLLDDALVLQFSAQQSCETGSYSRSAGKYSRGEFE